LNHWPITHLHHDASDDVAKKCESQLTSLYKKKYTQRLTEAIAA